ncbi:chemotaxis protein CheD [Halobellus salinisoli]|uniref:chemotaxis protein CheD n=1 Tax=Halobellus salinisoli TaxID=3108500 RepID=UPI00300B41E9
MKVYTTDRSDARASAARVKVGVADYAVAEAGSTLVTSGLGSCVGIALADVDAGVAGLAHAMLPAAGAERSSSRGDGESNEGKTNVDGADKGGTDGDTRPSGAKYVDTAIPALVAEMIELGAARPRIEARLAGGSAMFEFTSRAGAVGERNVAAARKTLDRHDIPLVASDVGGEHGRSLSFDAASAELSIRRAHGETQVL